LDQEMPGSLFFSNQRLNNSVFGYTVNIPPPVNQTLHFPPTVTMTRIDQSVTRILEPMFRMGLFDRPVLPLNTSYTNVTSTEHNAVARKLARAGMVLLKNTGSLLPLDKHNISSIALIGKDVTNPTVGGLGSGEFLPYYKSTPLAAIRQRFAGIVPPPPPPSSCPGKVLEQTNLANGDDVTSFPATSKCGFGPDCGEPNITFAECCAMCQRRGDPRGSPGICAAFSYVGVWNNGADYGPVHGFLNRGVDYTCNLHGSPTDPTNHSEPYAPYSKIAANKSCVNLTAEEGNYPCSVATSGIIRTTPPPPAPNCSADGKCVYHADGTDTSSATKLAANADVTIVFVSTNSGEGADRKSLSLGDETNKLIVALAASTPRLIVMVVHPGAVLTPWRDSVAALVAAFMPGERNVWFYFFSASLRNTIICRDRLRTKV
jgi:beta-glucosidase